MRSHAGDLCRSLGLTTAWALAHSMGVTCQEFAQYGIEALRLFLRQPVPGFLDEIQARGGGGVSQSPGLQRPRALIGAPVAAAGDEAGGHFDAVAVEGP